MTEHNDRKPGGLIPPGPVVLPPEISETELEQWETLCSVSTGTGICSAPAVDPTAPIKICAPHLGLAVALAMRRFPMIEAARIVEGEQS